MTMRKVLWLIAATAVLVLVAAPSQAFVQQVQIEAQIAQVNADDLLSRTPLAFQYTVNRYVRDYAAVRGDGLPWRVDLAYNNYDFLGNDGRAWTGLLAYNRPVNAWGWGVQVPEQYWSEDEFEDWLFEGVTPFAYYDVNGLRVGGFGHFNYAFTDTEGADEFSYGLGGFGSYKLNLTDKAWLTPTFVYTHYSPGQDSWDDSDIFTLGTSIDYRLSDTLGLYGKFFYTMDTSNDLIDDSFWEWQVGAHYQAAESVEIGGSFGTTEGFASFEEAWTFRLNFGFRF